MQISPIAASFDKDTMNMPSYRSSARVLSLRNCLLLMLVGSNVGLVETRVATAAIEFSGNVTPAPPDDTGNVNAPFLIGDVSTGTVTIDGGSALSVVNGSATVGDDATGYGVLTITGGGSRLSTVAAASDLIIGNLGTGNVLVDNFGSINVVDDLLIGAGNNSSGVVAIEGLGTFIDVNDTVHVGQGGEGVFEVTSAARMFADDTIIGSLATGYGRITISGLQSSWRQVNSMTVGDAGRGTLEVFDQARLETTNAVIGNAATGVGIVDVAGAGSFWEVTGFMNLGVSGESTMNVFGGGRVTASGAARLATLSAGESYVEVSGQHSLWAVDSILTVGDFGFGTLAILNAGRVTAGDNVVLGDNINSRGEAIVDGEGSTWEITGTLDVSQPGEAKLTISNGGLVTATGVARVAAAGELRLDGGRLESDAGSGLTNNGLVRGGGTIAAAVSNTNLGEIRIESGDALVMHNTLTNSGLIDVDRGELEVFGATTNNLDIDIRDGILRFQGGITNSSTSQLAIVGGDVDVFGTITNVLGGQVVVGGEAHAAFHDTFTNNGSLLVTPGAELLTLENLSFSGSGSFAVQLAEVQLDGFGQVQVGDTATLAGTLQVELVEGYQPAAGDSFQIITAGVGRNGFFSNEVLPLLDGGLDWDIQYNPNSVVLSVVSTSLIGDYNDDGIVDAADYVVWRKFDNTSATLPNDETPGIVDNDDYNAWRENFGAVAGGAGGGNSATGSVPEPSSAFLAGTAVVALALRRRFG